MATDKNILLYELNPGQFSQICRGNFEPQRFSSTKDAENTMDGKCVQSGCFNENTNAMDIGSERELKFLGHIMRRKSLENLTLHRTY